MLRSGGTGLWVFFGRQSVCCLRHSGAFSCGRLSSLREHQVKSSQSLRIVSMMVLCVTTSSRAAESK